MRKKLKKIVTNTFFVLFVILFVGIVLRAHNLTTWPRHGATFDEYAWTWLGINLIQNGVPASWSPHEQYLGHDRKHLIYQGAHFYVVKPYLEHPPGFGLVAGSFAIINGAENMYDISLGKIRPLALIMGSLSIVFLFLLIREIYDKKTALLSAFLYAIVPTVAIGSRLVQNENFYIPMFLASLFLTVKFLKTKKVRYRNIAALICGILIVSKIPWAAATLGVVSILFFNRRYRDGLIVLITAGIFFLGFIAYGFYFNSELFIELWRLQLQRYDITFNSFYALFTEPFLADRFMLDGWIYFGWISFFLLLVKDIRKNYVIILGLLSYLAVFIFAIPNEAGHGWYRYPFYPFLVVSIALFIREYFNKNLLLTSLFLIFIVLSLLELTWSRVFGFSFVVFRLFLIFCALSLLPIFIKNTKLSKFSAGINYLLLSVAFSLSIWTILGYNEQ